MSELYDIAIIGAGPAGCSAALHLENSGLKVLLLDRAKFPRDKICGDFVAIHGLRQLFDAHPHLREFFAQYPKKATNKSTALYVDTYSPFTVDWVSTSYVIKREDLDQALLEWVYKAGQVEVREGCPVVDLKYEADGCRISCKGGEEFVARLIIGADGAHGITAKKMLNYRIDKEHYGGSVRAYFSNMKNIDPAVNEIYVHKDVVPGYFWLFPLSETEANIGVGMHSRHIMKHKTDLKKVFYSFIEKHPALREKMGEAVMQGKLEGFGLPFYSKPFALSGDRVLLTGDAGQMIDPSSGEGILPALKSGRIAAKFALDALKGKSLMAEDLKPYEEEIHREFWPEMRRKSFLAKHFAHRYPLIKGAGYLLHQFPGLRRRVQKYV